MTLDQTRRARDRGGNRSGIDLRAAAVFRDVKQHGAAREIDLPCCFLKAENRIGSEARQSLIRERELGPGINTCAHGSAIANFITDDGWTRRCLRPQQFHVFHYLGEARFFQLRCS